ncbi:hypothetical protein AVEN_109130-1 [Araneus ventricosus]|uniref:Uncharacterized protein n=1 Tax=Araneus ventricosus TaxID=182803 RepID=A0A4Y2LIN7_ARAVE|nr:hypothetical protein AVEN_109130-1 [Araneus ventricosus]
MHDANSLKEGSFFATLSIRKQIAALLDLESVRESLSATLRQINEHLYDIPDSVSDLTDGELYKEKRRELFNDHDISLIMNTD